MGDAAGIGPEIILKSFKKISDVSNYVLIGNRKIFEANENICNIKLPDSLEFIDIDYDISTIQPNVESADSGRLAFMCLEKACNMANNNEINQIATAPLSKNALHLAGLNYSGQTEILQEFLGNNSNEAQMLFVADSLRILLLTRHISLRDIPELITKENISSTISILNNELKNKFVINAPKIAVCALNPHAGENGVLGREEIEVINPTIDMLKRDGINVEGAFSADTLLGKAVKNYKNPDYDAYLACYHDQALPAIKALGLDKVLNVTIGLKVLRVSPSHGTAFDIAYQNKADYMSMLNAMSFATK